jgi:hypothetical protein
MGPLITALIGAFLQPHERPAIDPALGGSRVRDAVARRHCEGVRAGRRALRRVAFEAISRNIQNNVAAIIRSLHQ